jgi:hypothetical protein
MIWQIHVEKKREEKKKEKKKEKFPAFTQERKN